MAFGNSKSKFTRFQDDRETAIRFSFAKLTKVMSSKQVHNSCLIKMVDNKDHGTGGGGGGGGIGEPSQQQKELTRVFSEDYATVHRMILDPRGPAINRWNKCLFVACMVSLFVDPLFFYLPIVKDNSCIDISMQLMVALTVVRSMVDVMYMIQIMVRFRTAYVAPSSRVIGRGELVIDPVKIASRYVHRDFWLDILAAVPTPQVLAWVVIPYIRGENMLNFKLFLRSTVIVQFFLRLYLIFPLSSQIIKSTGVVMKTAWAGAAYNLMLFMQVIGASWYLLAIDRQEECWKEVCRLQQPNCQAWYFECSRVNDDPSRAAWLGSSNLTSLCDPNGDFFQFGIYGDALNLGITELNFISKYLYCLWWGLRNLSSIGQNLFTSTYNGEIVFVIIIAILGLLLFALLIGNMQAYLQSTNMRLERWRIRRNDTEQWMRHRQLPHELKESVRRYDKYRWVSTHGVDEEDILQGLPLDLRRDIKRHLCLDLVRRVALFNQMDEHMLDAICERLKPVLCSPGTCLVREGDPANHMLFIIRGHLDSYTTDGGRAGFFNSCRLGPGDFCGEELLTWALDPRPSALLPSSTRTVKAISEVEAFALVSVDVKFVASKFRRLHSKEMKLAYRCHSPQWRTWAACFIQAAWFRFKRRKQAAALKAVERSNPPKSPLAEPPPPPPPEQTWSLLPSPGSGLAAMYDAKFQANTAARGGGGGGGSGSQQCGSKFDLPSPLHKPKEPDFSFEDR